MSISAYPSIVGYSEKGSVSASGNTSPSSPKSRYSAGGSITTSGRESVRALLHGKSAQSPVISAGSNASGREEAALDEGWPLLARLMERNPEFEAFARFRELNVKNLLYYQVELEYLSNLLEKEEVRDRRNARINSERDFYKFPLKMMQQYDDTGECMQWEYVLKMRRCLHEYNEAMLQYARVSALPDANGREMTTLVDWIVNPQGGNFSISGWGSQVWGRLYSWDYDKSFSDLLRSLWRRLKDTLPFRRPRGSIPHTRSDLVVPRPGIKADAVAAWITYNLVPWMSEFALVARGRLPEDRFRGSKLENITSLHVGDVNKVTSMVATAIACVLPTVAIGVLTTPLAVTNQQKLLWIGGFTTFFAVGLVAFTNEIPKAHVFMAAATFSAVLVVFIHE